MIFGFLIATLMIFTINLLFNLVVLYINIYSNQKPLIAIINVFVCLFLLTWNIWAIMSF